MTLGRALPLLIFVVACDGPGRDLGNHEPALPVERAPSAEGAARELEASLRALLRAPDVVIDHERLAALGPPDVIAAAFEKLLADPSLSNYEQTRVVSALRVLDDPRAETLLEDVLRDDQTSIFVRRVALKAYAHRAQARALPLLSRFAADDDRHTREAVIRALAGIADDGAAKLLAQRMTQDPAPDLRALAARLAESASR
jgi:hypothetical protein